MITSSNKSDYYLIPEIGYLPRVTKILSIISKGEAFNNWLKKSGKKADTLLTDAGDIGTSLHNRLEEIGKGIYPNLDALKPLEASWIQEFNRWSGKKIERFVETEKTVFHSRVGYAGTLDSLVQLKDKRIALLDYKTSKYIYDTYELQVSAYVKAYEFMKSISIDTAFILRFDKNGGKMQVKEVKNIDEQYDIFLCALRLWRWKYEKYQETLNKKEESNGLS